MFHNKKSTILLKALYRILNFQYPLYQESCMVLLLHIYGHKKTSRHCKVIRLLVYYIDNFHVAVIYKTNSNCNLQFKFNCMKGVVSHKRSSLELKIRLLLNTWLNFNKITEFR